MSVQLERRTWRYALEPADYEIAGCKCGNQDCRYSEFVDRLWCESCRIDFVPEHWGVFDGPIPIESCRIMGIVFDRIDLVRGVYQVFVTNGDDAEYVDHSGLALPAPLAA